MVDPMEVPDNLAQTKLPDKLKPVVRSHPERDRNGFSKALKEELEEELEEKRRKHGDSFVIEHEAEEKKQDIDKHEQPAEDRPEEVEETATSGDSADSDDPTEADESPSRHVDLRA